VTPIDPQQLEALRREKPLFLLKLGTEWCQPCKTVDVALQKVEEQTGVPVYKADLDAHPELGQRFRVQSIPTVIKFVQGDPVEVVTGGRLMREYVALVR
jgi:thioredoxin 1